jgi:dTDP-4-dehydrorhamnose 3,5-epimerase
VTLDDVGRRAVYLAEGLGHAFCALRDDATVAYLCSTTYNPAAEHAVSPLDIELAVAWPDDLDLVLSKKDRAAPTLATALADGPLPTLERCQAQELLATGRV